jgi:hypothetical protein
MCEILKPKLKDLMDSITRQCQTLISYIPVLNVYIIIQETALL